VGFYALSALALRSAPAVVAQGDLTRQAA
jgi:hypothetical protein